MILLPLNDNRKKLPFYTYWIFLRSVKVIFTHVLVPLVKSCNIYTCTVTADGKVYTEAGLKVSQEHMLIFFTGTDREPPLGFPKHPQLIFLHTGILATASTCDLILRIPTVFHNNYLAFRDMMVESLVSSEGFGVA